MCELEVERYDQKVSVESANDPYFCSGCVAHVLKRNPPSTVDSEPETLVVPTLHYFNQFAASAPC